MFIELSAGIAISSFTCVKDYLIERRGVGAGILFAKTTKSNINPALT